MNKLKHQRQQDTIAGAILLGMVMVLWYLFFRQM